MSAHSLQRVVVGLSGLVFSLIEQQCKPREPQLSDPGSCPPEESDRWRHLDTCICSFQSRSSRPRVVLKFEE